MESGSSAGNWGSSQLFGMHFIASHSGCLSHSIVQSDVTKNTGATGYCVLIENDERFITPSSESLRGAKLNSLPFTG